MSLAGVPRFLLPPDSWSSAALSGSEARHLSQVLRIKPGQQVTVFDGCGREAQAEVISTQRERVELTLGTERITPPTKPSITLAQAIPKGKNMDLIVQKAVELGVARIQPLITRNTVVQPGDGKADKWRRTALEACKQCGQNTLPDIPEPMTFEAWIRQADGHGLRLMASLADGAKPLRDTLQSQPACEATTMLIGPEGDFSPSETEAAIAAGFLPVSLGEIVLRVETASLFCLSALKYQYG